MFRRAPPAWAVEMRDAVRQLSVAATSPSPAAAAFELEKYKLDRAHELELNRIQSTLQVGRLKVVQLLNGGGFAILVTFVKDAGGAPRSMILLAIGAALWVLGLVYAALAMAHATQAQSKYTRAYRMRREAFELVQAGAGEEAEPHRTQPVRWKQSRFFYLRQLLLLPEPLRQDWDAEDTGYRVAQLRRVAYETHQNGKALAGRQRCLFAASLTLFVLGGILVGIASFSRPPAAAAAPTLQITL